MNNNALLLEIEIFKTVFNLKTHLLTIKKYDSHLFIKIIYKIHNSNV